MARRRKSTGVVPAAPGDYGGLVADISGLLDQARRAAARAVNSILTATYWDIGRRIVEFEQGGRTRAEYGEELLKKLSWDLTDRFGRGFSKRNLELMRVFYRGWEIAQTPSAQFEARVRLPAASGSSEEIFQTPSGKSGKAQICPTASSESAMPTISPTASAKLTGKNCRRCLQYQLPCSA